MRLLSCLLLCLLTSAQAMPIETTDTQFDLKQANQRFDQINIKLSVEDLNLHDLEEAIKALDDLENQAEECVSDHQKKINNINDLTQQNSTLSVPDKHDVDLVYLNTQKKTLLSQQAQCRLFSIRAKEAIEAYRVASSKLVKEEALTQEMPLWTAIREFSQQTHEESGGPFFHDILPNALPSLEISLSFIFFSFIAAALLLAQAQASQFSRPFLRIQFFRVSLITLLGLTFSTGGLFLYDLVLSHMHPELQTALILSFSTLLFCYFLAVLFILIIFKLKTVRGYLLLNSFDCLFFRNISLAIVTFFVIGLSGTLFATNINTDDALWQLCQSVYLLAVLMTSIFFTHYFCREHCQNPTTHYYGRFSCWVITLWLIACAVIDIQGYHLLASRLTISSLMTCAITFLTAILALGVHKLYLALYYQPRLFTWVSKHIGYRKDQIFIEFFILKTTIQILIVGTGVYFIGENIDFATYYVESFYSQMIDGIHVGSVTIFPLRIISGIIIFCLLFLIFRGISSSIVRHKQSEEGEETQVALASILTYAGFLFAIISGLIIAGFNFTGLAIVAGALSVGIGLGLQSIVNNFVSGLILLIEKPIRPGDRINVDGAEGFVKKIRIRSTQIITPSREDIIIPNSDLITRRVTNYMFSDKNCRISCDIGVVYGSDTQLVKNTLLTIANLHEDVVKTGRSKPFVLFRAFADNKLSFQLWCLIKDVNKKLQVQSDLNFSIEDMFRKQNIVMASPPREIQVFCSESTQKSTLEEKKPN